MKRIGVTGGIGSGKSTFCTLLGYFGAEIFNADSEATRIMEAEEGVKKHLARLMGSKTFLPDGKLNRAFISELAFSNQNVLDTIGEIVHPVVQRAFLEQSNKAEKRGLPAFIREAAILPNSIARKDLDLIVSVLADKELRINRVIERSRLTKEQVEARITAQPTDEEYAAGATCVIYNNGSESELAEEAETFWKTLVIK